MINEKRAKWHLRLPVCRTKRGLKLHLANAILDDIRLLMMYLHCSLEDLTEKAWRYIKPVKESA
ncbi:MAG: hypothetical protein FVQ82_12955 [Planctomycetes bacterium]|nr:hypothetical protein [Planctomycetota bacterium]